MENVNLFNLLLKAGVLDTDTYMRYHAGESLDDIVKSAKEWRAHEDTHYLQEREDLTKPCTLDLEEVAGLGTDLAEIEAHERELASIVDKMKEDLVNETKILEGTPIPTYDLLLKNELSNGEQETK